MSTLLCKGCLGLIALGSWFMGSIGGEVMASPPMPMPGIGATVIIATDGLLVEWRAPMAHIVAQADGTSSVALPGYSQTAQPGAPLLPFNSVLVAVPPGATPVLRVILAEDTDELLPGPLALAPFPEGAQRDASGLLIGGDFVPASSAQAVRRNEGDSVVLEPMGVERGVSLARLVFYPVRPIGNYAQARVRITTYVRVSVTFIGQTVNLRRAAALDPVLAPLLSAVINPEQLQLSTVTSQSQTVAFASTPHNSNVVGSMWAIKVITPGLTAISYEALAAMGFPVVSADPHALHLARAGIEIAAEWDGNGNASFEPGERLLFYAEPRFSRWTSADVYFLWQDATTSPLRIQNRSTAPTGQPVGNAWIDQTAESNRLYTPDCFCGSIPPGRDGDHWTWGDLKRPGPSTASYTVSLPTVAATQPATLTVWLIGYTDVAVAPDHRVDVALNGAGMGRIEWDGKQSITATLPITPGILRSDVNTLTLTLPGMPGVAIEGAWLDAFSIRYARGSAGFGNSVNFTGQPAPHAYRLALSSNTGLRVYDITSPELPLRLTDVITVGNTISFTDPLSDGPHRYALMTASGIVLPVAIRPAQPLQTGAGFAGADYVMIAPADFIPALTGLIALRQSQGLSVVVENIQAIYDVYGDGRPDPATIRAYLAHAYTAWTPRPTYVILVGDGSFDPRQYRANSTPTFIPPYLVDVDPWAGETAADNRYVTVDGSDTLPDMLIGRLPVKTVTETQVVVDKIVQYETRPFPGNWDKTVTFVADNADEAGNFAAASEVIATTYVSAPFTAQRIYYTPPASLITITQKAVLDQWNAGALFIQYTGHSSWQQWALERFFHLDDLPALHNDRRWPVVIEMTCFTGAFQRPEPTLDEGLLTLQGGGAIATWGSTGLGVSTGHASLDEGFFRAVFSETVNTVGQAVWAGKLSLAITGQHLDLLDTYTLLGDPALRLNWAILPWAHRAYLPILMRNQNTP